MAAEDLSKSNISLPLSVCYSVQEDGRRSCWLCGPHTMFFTVHFSDYGLHHCFLEKPHGNLAETFN